MNVMLPTSRFHGNLQVAVPREHLALQMKRDTSQWKLTVCLARKIGRPYRTNELVEIVYADCEDGGPMTANVCVNRMVFRLRRLFKPLGWQISQVGHSGYFLELREGFVEETSI